MKTITVRHLVPVSFEDWGGPCVDFYQWLPDSRADALIRQEGDIIGKLWLDYSCIMTAFGPVDEEFIKKRVNLTVHKVYVDVTICNIDEDLLEFIFDERDAPKEIHHGIMPTDAVYRERQEAYLSLGVQVYKFAMNMFNRFVSFARNHKGQYWLPEYETDCKNLTSQNNHFQTIVKIDESDWVRWCPLHTDITEVTLSNGNTSISKEDWQQVRNFVASNNRPNLVLELLANSEMLVNEGRRRSAIIEAASAMEVALFSFAKAPEINQVLPTVAANRIDSINLKSQIEHLGFSGSFRYLIPLLFAEELLPTSALKACYKIIEIRNNVVHHGQRDVDAKGIRQMVAAARKVCQVLIDHTV